MTNQDFDLDAFRTKMEDAQECYETDSAEYQVFMFLLDLLPPKPQPTPEEVGFYGIWSGCAGSRAQCERDANGVVRALREAGMLREGL